MISDENWEYILKEATLCYRKKDIKKFVKMWNAGESIGVIADQLFIRVYEVALLIIHCELEDLIGPRPGKLEGTKKPVYRRRKEGAG